MTERIFIPKTSLPDKRSVRKKYGTAVKVWDLKTSWLIQTPDIPSWGWASNAMRPRKKR